MADLAEMILDTRECCSNTEEEREELKERGFIDYLLVDWEPTSMCYRGNITKEYDPCAPASTISDYDLPLAGKLYVLFGRYTFFMLFYLFGNLTTELNPTTSFFKSLWSGLVIAVLGSFCGALLATGAYTGAKQYKTAVECDLWVDQMSEEEFLRVWPEKRSCIQSCGGCISIEKQMKEFGRNQRAMFGSIEENSEKGCGRDCFMFYYFKCVLVMISVMGPLVFCMVFSLTAALSSGWFVAFTSLLLVIVLGWIQAGITKLIIYHLKVSCCKQSKDAINNSLLGDDVANSEATPGYGSVAGAAKV